MDFHVTESLKELRTFPAAAPAKVIVAAPVLINFTP